jgi:hypothetical protein
MGEGPISNQAAATPTNALPDVIVTTITWSPTNIIPGNNVYFTATVKNQGSAPAPGNGTSIGIGFDVDGAGGIWSGGYTGPLQPGASVNLTANGGVGPAYWVATAGSHTVTANADDINRFPEGNKDNNVLSVPFTIFPVVPPPKLTSVKMINSAVSFIWSTYPGKTYRVLYKDALNATSWTSLGSDSVAAGYARFRTDTNAPSHQRFYRVLQVN